MDLDDRGRGSWTQALHECDSILPVLCPMELDIAIESSGSGVLALFQTEYCLTKTTDHASFEDSLCENHESRG